MSTYPNTQAGAAAALAAASADVARLWFDRRVIRVLPLDHGHRPDKVTRRQFKQGLTRLGIRPAVEAWRVGLDTSTAARAGRNRWYDGNDIERANPILNSMAAQFGLTAAQVDAAICDGGAVMDYAAARPLIRSGDVIGVMSRKGPLAWITRAQ